jgi:Tfp pilus assembly protein PilO
MIRRVALIGLAGLLVVVAGWYLVFWRSESAHLKALKNMEAIAANNVAQLQAQLGALRTLQREVPAERAALSKLDQDVPDGPSLDELIDVVNHAASAAGVRLISISTPSPAGWGTSSSTSAQGPTGANANGAQSMPLAVSVNGTNTGLLHFVTELDSAPRLFVVDNFSLNASGATQAGAASVQLEAYYVSAGSGDPASTFPFIDYRPAPKGTPIVATVSRTAQGGAKSSPHSHK